MLTAYPLAPFKFGLNLVEFFRRDNWFMAVFHIVLRNFALILFFLFREKIDREAFLVAEAGLEPAPSGL